MSELPWMDLDMAFCHSGRIQETGLIPLYSRTIPYTAEWLRRLKGLPAASALDFTSADYDYGHLLGCLTRDFHQQAQNQSDFNRLSRVIPVFHRPEKGITSQLGNGGGDKAGNRFTGYL